MMKTRITEAFGIEYPIFQGGMAWVSEAKLAAAVSNAGGLGIISAMNLDADYLRGQIRACREATDKPFGVNIMLMSPHVEEVAQLVMDEHVPVVTTGAVLHADHQHDARQQHARRVPLRQAAAHDDLRLRVFAVQPANEL